MFSAATKTNNVVAAAPSTDPYFYDVTLLLNGDGTSGAQNNTFLDSSTNAFTVTRNGTPTQGTFTPFGSLWSNYFNGSTDYLSTPLSTALQLGTGDFTIELWSYLTSRATSYPAIFSNFSSYTGSGILGLYAGHNGGTITQYQFLYGSTGFPNIQGGTIAYNTWTHLAAVRSGTTITLYVNGTSVGSITGASANLTGNGSNFYVGVTGDGISGPYLSYINGYISNFRIVKGTAVYTSNFTPPTAPLTAITNTSLLTCQSSRFVDNSTNNFTVTPNGSPSVQRFSPFNPTSAYSTSVIGGGMYFNGSTDYLSSPNINFSTNNFTIEGWFYFNSIGSYVNIWGTDNGTGANPKLCLACSTPTNLVLFTPGGASINFTTSIATGTWYHLAVVRSGTGTNQVSLYVNGVSAGAGTISNNLSSITSVFYIAYIGEAFGPTFNGYISNFRIVNGTAVYTSNFTPPTAPLTAITNTSLLLSGTNAGIPDYAMQNDLVTVGAAQVSTTQKKFGTGSINYNGTTSYLRAPSSYTASFGTGNFTIEMWIYPTSLPANSSQSIFANWPTGTPYTVGQFNLFVGAWGSGVTYISFSYATTTSAATNFNSGTGSSVITVNAWNFVSLVRSGTSLTIYVNGTSVATTTLSTSTVIGVNSTATSGSTLPTGSDYFAGYIDDLRVTKGYARPTTTPTAAWPLY